MASPEPKALPEPKASPEPKALPITKFAAAYGIHPTTVWRALREGRLDYVIVGKRKLVLAPPVQKAPARAE
jgi:hypothetical protein